MKKHQYNKNDWSKALSEQNSKGVWIYCVIVSIIGITVLVAVKNMWLPAVQSEATKNIATIAIDACSAVATGILGAAILNLVYSVKENGMLKMLRSLPYTNLLADFYDILSGFQGKCRKDERIEVTMKPFINEHGEEVSDLITINIDYDFRTNMIKDSIKLLYERCLDGDINRYLAGTNERLNGLEFYWGNDETGIGFKSCDSNGKPYVTNESYKLTTVSVDAIALEVPEPNVTKSSNGKNIMIAYDIPLTKTAKKAIENSDDDFSQVVISVSFPMDSESVLSITHEYPTNDSKVSVDYSGVVKDTYVYLMPATGPVHVEELQQTKENYCEYRHLGWLIPKTGYIITWWKQ